MPISCAGWPLFKKRSISRGRQMTRESARCQASAEKRKAAAKPRAQSRLGATPWAAPGRQLKPAGGDAERSGEGTGRLGASGVPARAIRDDPRHPGRRRRPDAPANSHPSALKLGPERALLQAGGRLATKPGLERFHEDALQTGRSIPGPTGTKSISAIERVPYPPLRWAFQYARAGLEPAPPD